MNHRRPKQHRVMKPRSCLIGSCVMIVGACLAMLFVLVRGGVEGEAAEAAQGTDASPGHHRPPVADAPSAPRPTPSPSQSAHVVRHGAGTFTRAPAGSRTFGHGKPLRYVVEAEDGTEVSARSVAAEVDRVLGDPRGWTRGGAAFRRVAGPPYDFRVRLATPDTTDRLCGAYGLDTGGEVNCAVGADVVVNLKRWLLLSPYYPDRPAEYHALIINHEVGHRLGHGHRDCPAPGRPAPAMMQQIKGLHGCVANAWPYDANGSMITGPATP